MILREVTGKEDAMITMMGVPLPAEAIVVDLFSRIFSRQLPTFLLLMFILPLYNTVFAIVKEKESKAKESMRMMGMVDTSFAFTEKLKAHGYVQQRSFTRMMNGLHGNLDSNNLTYAIAGPEFG